MMLRHESVLAFLESLSGDDSGSKRLGIFHVDDNWLQTVTTKKLPTPIGVTRNFKKNPNKPASFYASTFHTKTKMILGELSAVFIDHHTDSASNFVEF